MQIFLLALPFFCISSIVALPAAPSHNDTNGSSLPDIGALTPNDDANLKVTRPLLTRPPAPYLYEVHEVLRLWINFTEWGREAERADGDILLYRVLFELRRAIQDNPQHEQAIWHGLYVTHENHLLLGFVAISDTVTLGDLWWFLTGLARFMRIYGFVETRFRMGRLTPDKFERLAAGYIEIYHEREM
ncbi:MAG: hypothetical protein Q9225_001663 [Loekoesia sp. 1 TL-2023]